MNTSTMEMNTMDPNANEKMLNGTEANEMEANELEASRGGVTHPVDGVIDFFSWVACGFHHNYKYTGKKQTRLDLFWHVTFYERKCQDCGHVDWTRSEP